LANNGGQGRTRTCEGRHTIQHRHTYAGRHWGDKTSGRRTHLPTQAHMCHNGRQAETRLREGGHTIQHRHTCGETMGDKGRQGETRPWEGGHRIQHFKADTLRKHFTTVDPRQGADSRSDLRNGVKHMNNSDRDGENVYNKCRRPLYIRLFCSASFALLQR